MSDYYYFETGTGRDLRKVLVPTSAYRLSANSEYRTTYVTALHEQVEYAPNPGTLHVVRGEDVDTIVRERFAGGWK